MSRGKGTRVDPSRPKIRLRYGPMAGQVYYADDFKAMQAAARATTTPSRERTPACLLYAPTRRHGTVMPSGGEAFAVTYWDHRPEHAVRVGGAAA